MTITRSALRTAGNLVLCGASTVLTALLLGLACGDDPAGPPSGPLYAGEIAGPEGPPADGGSHGRLTPASLELPYAGSTNPPSPRPAFWIIQQGTGNSGLFVTSNSNNGYTALQGSAYGYGAGVAGFNSGTGPAGLFSISGTVNSRPALQATTLGTGAVLLVNHQGSSGPLALFQRNGANKIRFTREGKGFFNGGTQTGGADVAESFEVEGRVRDYAPGDVLLISTRRDRRVEKSTEPYSTRIAGVVATKPGVLLTERDIDANLDDTVPVGIVGVIPTKVSAENGAIRRGDLLVTARTAGHAMRGTARSRMLGATIGRALAEFRGPGTGVIPVLVNVK